MSAAPSFSSSDSVAKNLTGNVNQIKVPDEEFDWYFEVEQTVTWINANNLKKVALQFPDELLNSAPKLCLRLESLLHFKPYLLADTSYGSCCVDDIAAQHVNADCIIHYGEACMSKVQSGRSSRVKYVLPKKSLDVRIFGERFGQWAADELSGKTFSLFLDTCYLHYKDESCALLESMGYCSDLVIDYLDFSTSKPVDCILFVGSTQSKRANLIALTNPTSQIFSFDPAHDYVIRKADFSANRTLRKRLYLIERAKDANVVGIVIGTVNVSDYLAVLERTKFLCKNAGKKYYVLYVGKLNVAKLSNFAEIDIFVLLSCPFGVIFDWSDYPKPIITPFEFGVACNNDPNSGLWMAGAGWRPDSASILDTSANDAIKTDHNASYPETDFSLTGGRLRNLHVSDFSNDDYSLIRRSEAYQIQPVTAEDRFKNRTWKGLEENIGQTPVRKVKEGRKGIASGYDDEHVDGIS